MGELQLPTLEKFNKESVYKFLQSFNDVISFSSAEDETLFDKLVEENFKPQKGGGATANPPREIDGELFHYCRMFKDYLPEAEMSVSKGQVKGISKLGQSFSYTLKKEAEKLKMDSIPLYQAGQIDEANAKMAEAGKIEAKIEDPQTYIDEKARLEAEALLETGTDTESDNELV